MSYVFISYSHADGDFALALIRELERGGLECWVDNEELRAGGDWRREIDDAIRDAFALVVVITPDAKSSEYVTYEWAFALGSGVEVIPVVLKSAVLHPRLESLQFLDFSYRASRPWDKLVGQLKDIEGGDNSSTSSRSGKALKSRGVAGPDVSELLGKLKAGTYFREKQEAMLALAAIKYERAVPYIVRVLLEDSLAAEAAARALGMMGSPDAISGLGRAIGMSKEISGYPPSASKEAAQALGMIGDKRAVPILVSALNGDNYGGVKSVICQSLEMIGTAEALDAVRIWKQKR